MNTAIKNLEKDHESILKLIDVMEALTTKTDPVIEDFEEMVDLIRNFADGLHHAKEETLFFPLMAERGFSMKQGPIAMMLSEHEQGRNYVKGISENIRLLKEGDLSALNLVHRNMLGYCELLRNHIAKENNVLFRMADNALSEEDHQSLLVQFGQIENQVSANNHENDFITRIEKLTQIYHPN